MLRPSFSASLVLLGKEVGPRVSSRDWSHSHGRPPECNTQDIAQLDAINVASIPKFFSDTLPSSWVYHCALPERLFFVLEQPVSHCAAFSFFQATATPW